MRAAAVTAILALLLLWPASPDEAELERELERMEAQSEGLARPASGGPYWHRENSGASGGRADADIDLRRARVLSRLCWHPARIAILDGGFLASRGELRGRWGRGRDLLHGDDDPFVVGPEERLRHGTAVAALAAEASIWPWIKIVPIRISDEQGRFQRLEEAIRLAADMGVDVINVSAGGPAFRFDPERLRRQEDALRYAVARGAFVSLSAGNYGYDNSRGGSFAFHPASLAPRIPGVVAVAASDAADRLWSGSNTGAELAAPGARVYSAGRFDHDVVVADGTSLAAPLVAGTAALLRACRPALSPARLEEILTESADPLHGPRSGEVGGRLNAARAVQAALLDTRQGAGGGQR